MPTDLYCRAICIHIARQHKYVLFIEFTLTDNSELTTNIKKYS